MLEKPAVRSVKMSDEETRVNEILARFGDLTESQDPAIQEYKKNLEDFLENGPGTLEERRRMLVEKMLEMDASYKNFLGKRN
jgi:hypothetical protein